MTVVQPGPHHEIEVSVSDARGHLPELLDKQIRDGSIVYLTRYGSRVGALVPADLAERLDELEDDYWSRRAVEVLSRSEPTVPWDQAVTELEAGDQRR